MEGTSAGWQRTTHPFCAQSVKDTDQGESFTLSRSTRRPCSDGECDTNQIQSEYRSGSSAYKNGDGANGHGRSDAAGVEYRLHEFGLMYPSHDFAYWPGFSLNPALWDLTKLEHKYRLKYDRPLHFNPQNIR